MTDAGASGFLDALRALSAALERLGTPAMIIGGVAVAAHGVPRLTVDIDATVAAAQVSPAHAVTVLAQEGIVPRIPDAEPFARQHHVLLAVHEASGTPVDLSFGWLSFEEEALRASEACDYAGVAIRVARAEDLIIYKLVASRPRDVDDVEALLGLHGQTMHLDRVRRTVAEFAALLDDEERPRTLERLIRKANQ